MARRRFHVMTLWNDSDAVRQIAKTQIGDALVSTSFLSLDRNPGLNHHCFSQMRIAGGLYHNERGRCATWEEAEVLHANAVAMVRANLDKVAALSSKHELASETSKSRSAFR
jgi:hypothetical protein